MLRLQTARLRTTVTVVGVLAAVAALTACSHPNGHSSAAPESSAGSIPSAQPSAPNLAPAQFAVFSGAGPTAPRNAQCSLDDINGQPARTIGPVPAGSVISFSGWAGNGKGQPATRFVLLLKGAQQAYSVPLTFNFARPDVATALNSAAMARSGFNLNASLRAVPKGVYSVYFANPANPSSDCDTHRVLDVQ